MAGADPSHPLAREFVHALRDAGLVEGRNIIIERRSAEGQGLQRILELMQEVVSLNVDVIVTTGPGVRAAKDATDRIPIVGVVDNPLDSELIDSLARPGHNITGFGASSPAIYGKELQLLKEAAPTISRVAMIGWRRSAEPRRSSRVEAEIAARELRLSLLWLGVDKPEQFEAAFAAITRERADALIAQGTHVNYAHRQRIADFALKRRMPSLGFADAGMLMDYGADDVEGLRRAAVFVRKILDGAKPADLPFEQPTKYLLAINLRTAKALGITIPQSLLARADEVIQ
jgi:putative ABC transport system substrate-binding protein